MFQLFASGWISHLVVALLETGVIDEMSRGTRDAAELAAETGCDLDALTRFLRAGSAVDVFAEPEPGQFILTDMGDLLRSDVPGSLRAAAQLGGVEEFARTLTHADRTLRTGRPAFEEVYGQSLYDYLVHHPEMADRFHRAMNAGAATKTLLAAYDFGAVDRVVDIGAGEGALVASILAVYPHLTGTVFDRPEVVAGAKDRVLGPAGLAQRCRVVGGDFFESVPGDGDVYVLSRVLHNWDDAAAARILGVLRVAMKPEAHLLIVGYVPHPDDRTPLIPAYDTWMLIQQGGRQRTLEQYEALFEKTDLRLNAFVHHPDAMSVIDVMAR